MFCSASLDLKTKARYGVDEESAEMRIDTTGLFDLHTRLSSTKNRAQSDTTVYHDHSRISRYHNHSQIEESKTVSET